MDQLFLILSFGVIANIAQDILFPDYDELYPRYEHVNTVQRPFGLDEFKKSNELLAADLYRELRNVETGNFLLCPYSLQIIFALVHASAREKTSKEIANALHFPDDSNKIQEAIQKLSLNTYTPYTLTSVNKVYLAHRFNVNNNFKTIAQNVFKADIERIDLSERKEAASKINQWVEQETKNTIKNLIDEKYLGPDAVSVLINALYFNADWLQPFDSILTRSSTFYVNRNKEVRVKMMETSAYSKWYNNPKLDATFLEMPYLGEEVSMTVVLPNQVEGLPLLEQNIENVLEQQPLVQSNVQFTVTMPKFKMETSIVLEEILKNMGIREAFTRQANFSGMTVGEHKIFISHAIQKTFIRVTEKGTTAGAATASVYSDRSFGLIFKVNHPFIYILRHRKNGILFVGKFSDPSGTEVE